MRWWESFLLGWRWDLDVYYHMHCFVYIFGRPCGLKNNSKISNILFNLFIVAYVISIGKIHNSRKILVISKVFSLTILRFCIFIFKYIFFLIFFHLDSSSGVSCSFIDSNHYYFLLLRQVMTSTLVFLVILVLTF